MQSTFSDSGSGNASVRIVFDCKRQKFNHVGLNSMGSCHMIISSLIQISGVSGTGQCQGQHLCVLLIFPHVQVWVLTSSHCFCFFKARRSRNLEVLTSCMCPCLSRKKIPQKSLQQISAYIWGQRVKREADKRILDYVASLVEASWWKEWEITWVVQSAVSITWQ